MSEMQEITYELCDSCKYSMYMNISVDKKKYLACDYLSRTNKSRVFKNGVKVVPTGYCDKYEERVGERKTGHRLKVEQENTRKKRLKEAKEKAQNSPCKTCRKSRKSYDLYGVTLTEKTCVFICEHNAK